MAGLDGVFIQWAQVQEACRGSRRPQGVADLQLRGSSFKDRGDHVEVQRRAAMGRQAPCCAAPCSSARMAPSRCRAALHPWRTRLAWMACNASGRSISPASWRACPLYVRPGHPPWLPAPGEGPLVATELHHKAKLNCFLVTARPSFLANRMSTSTAKQLRAPAQITGGQEASVCLAYGAGFGALSGLNEDLQMVAATGEENIFAREILGRRPLTRWSSRSGRVVLIGDAAHAMHPSWGQSAEHGLRGCGRAQLGVGVPSLRNSTAVRAAVRA